MKFLNKKTRNQGGFTLMEMIAVIIVIGLVAAFVGPRLFGQSDAARARLAVAAISDLGGKLELYKLDVGKYPTTSEGLKALAANPGNANNWNGPYAKEEQIKDPWGNAYAYTSPGQKGPYEIKSLGADGKDGGDGPDKDITN